jgi:hypothetical protein
MSANQREFDVLQVTAAQQVPLLTIAVLSGVAFPRLLSQLFAGDSLAWHIVKALEELSVLDRVRSPAVHTALNLLPDNITSLDIVHLRCAVTVDKLARIGRLRRLELLGELPSSTNIYSVADKLTETIDTHQLMPFAYLTKTTVLGQAKYILSLLKLLSVAVATTSTTTTTTTTTTE